MITQYGTSVKMMMTVGRHRFVEVVTKIMSKEIVQISTGNHHTLARDSLKRSC